MLFSLRWLWSNACQFPLLRTNETLMPIRRLVAACLLLFLLVPPLVADEDDERAAQHQAELEALRERIETLRDRLSETRGERDAATQALREAEQEVGRLSRSLREIENRIAEQRERLASLRAEQAEREARIREEREALRRQIQGAYRTGREEQLKLLLNQEDPAAIGRMLVYYDYLNRARTERIESIQAHVRRLRTLAAEVDDTLSTLAETRREREDALAAMEATREDREAAVARIEEQLQSRGQRLTRLEQDEAELERLIRSLQDALGDIPSDLHRGRDFGSLRGELPWPVGGSVQRAFGDDRAGGRMRWQGMLIDADSGSEVRAVSHGRVAYADWLQHYGLVLILDHGDGWLSLYGHNQALYQEVGDWVSPGDVIATVGDSGGQTRSGLYFEIRRDGDPVNPARWLTAQ